MLLFIALRYAEAIQVLKYKSVLPTPWEGDDGVRQEVYVLSDPGQYAVISPSTDGSNKLTIFCYAPLSVSLYNFWSSTSLKLDIASTKYEVYMGYSVSSTVSLSKARETAWFYSSLPWKSKEFNLSPFEDACIGVQTEYGYTIALQWKFINYMMTVVTMTGLMLFWMAPTLSRNPFFHYTSGIILGLFTSILIVTYFTQKRLKQSFFSWMGLVYSASVYFMIRTWFNLMEYLTEQYIPLLVGYVIVVSIISFATVYRMGPPSNPRTINLIQWAIQLVSLVMVALSSYHQAASLFLSLSIFTWASIPANLKSGVNTQIRMRLFKPKVKLLSELEYNTQAHEETRKALEQLKNYCRSAESKPWRTVLRLKSPERFAEFIEGSPHLTEAEVVEYSHWDYDSDDFDNEMLTDDDDDDVTEGDNVDVTAADTKEDK